MSAEGLLGKVLKTFLESKKDRDIKELSPIIDKVAAVYPQLSSLTNDELRAKTTYFKEKADSTYSTRNKFWNNALYFYFGGHARTSSLYF